MICTNCGLNLEREKPIVDGPFDYDPAGPIFSIDGARLRCRSQVSELLGSVMHARGRPLAYGVIAERLGYEGDDPKNLVHVLASQARGLIAQCGYSSPIETVRGYGLRWHLGVRLST
jgi:DNA-binding response OmpR family regulator